MLTGLTAHSHLLLVNSGSLAASLNSQGTLLAPWCYKQVEDSRVPLRVLTGSQQLSVIHDLPVEGVPR